ncbi:hypothetical protein CMV_022077 [Castanea mollissima]|uniref:Uncharacterized protein n=1 Tax=Castanea mollissima TaxID=60419 RepID=A0A8J4QVD1_9ROSI|nr:hypothetical protein CMV_022077 [Castanea mollissima]
MQGFEFRIEVNLDAMTHLRIWKPIMKNASTLAEKISMEVTQDLCLSIKVVLLAFNLAIQYARSSIDRFISFQPSKSICRQVFSLIYALWKFVFGFGLLVSLLTVDPKKLRDTISDQVPSDGLFLEGHSLKVDESSMTGENKDKYLFEGIDQQSTQGKVCVEDSYYCPQPIR